MAALFSRVPSRTCLSSQFSAPKAWDVALRLLANMQARLLIFLELHTANPGTATSEAASATYSAMLSKAVNCGLVLGSVSLFSAAFLLRA